MGGYFADHFRFLPQPWWAVVGLYELMLLGAWLIEYVLLHRIRERTGDPIGGRARDRRYVWMWLVQFALLQAPLTRAGRWETPLPLVWPCVWTGVVLAVGGMAIRLSSILWLRENFSYVVNVGSEHRLITTGPYRLVRHPAYTGLIIFFAGIPLILCDLWILILVMLYVGIAVFRRIRREERWLKERFGEQYEAWRRQTKLLIPYLL